jgi:radical SAM superfamily enzyme YgiQ (UPF0313 family)
MRIAVVGAEFEENLAIRYIRGALEQAGHQVVQIVFNQEAELERAAAELAGSQADVAGMSMVFTYRAREFARLALRARELGFSGHMVAGGHFAAFNAERLLSDVPAFDSVGVGEGEGIVCDLAAHLGDLAAVPGLVWRNPAGEIVRNAPAVKPPDLDSLPSPTRKEPFDTYLGIPIVNMLSSRGCTHSCAFCSIAAWHKLCGGERFRMRSPESVAHEMAELYGQGVRIFNFHDDNFLPRHRAAAFRRVRALKRELDRRGVGRIAFAIKARPDDVDEELFATLKDMGLFRVFLGVEAGTAESLRRLGRGQTRDDNERALAVVNQLDIHTCFNLLMLNPDSTLEDFAANAAFLRQHPHNPMNFCRTEIYAGTPLEAKLRREGRLLGDYWGYDYQIADPRAQSLYDVVYPVFRTRNYGDQPLHHKTMSVDYEYQLLAHFFQADAALRARVKGYITTVNLNTCEHLEAIVATVARGLADRHLADFSEERRALVEADNRRLTQVGDDILGDVAACALRGRPCLKSGWVDKAVAAGLAAALTLGSTGHSQVHEMIAKPPPVAKETPSLRAEVARRILPRVAEKLDRPLEIALVFVPAENGVVATCTARCREKPDREAQVLVVTLKDIVIEEAEARGKRCTLEFSAREVRLAMPKRPNALPLRAQVAAQLLPLVSAKLAKPAGLKIRLAVDDTWEVTDCEFQDAGTSAVLARLPVLDTVLSDVEPGAYAIEYSADEVKAALDAAREAAPPLGNAALVAATFRARALPQLAKEIRPACDILVELFVDENGGVRRFAIHGARLPDAAAETFSKHLRTVLFGEPAARSKRFVVSFSKQDLESAIGDTHKHEMVPSHFFERAPDRLR